MNVPPNRSSSGRVPVPLRRDTPSTLFGAYEIVARIGRGATGTVFLAHPSGERGLDRLFTVKVFEDADEAFAAGLLRAANLVAQVQHPNLLRVQDVGSCSTGYYIVTDYIEGCTLAEMQHRHRDSRPPRVLLPIVIDALLGLHAAHSIADDTGQHLVHGDMSPQNLLLGVDGGCRVRDFGVTRARKPPYMCPELVSGLALDARSDVFSTGVVLWNALTGKRLFQGSNDESTMVNVLKRQIPRPSTVGLHPPEALDAVIMKALDRDPARRFQTADDMAIALRDVAIANGCIGSQAEVAEWVATTFTPEIEARRRLLCEIADRLQGGARDPNRVSLAAFASTLVPLEPTPLDSMAHLSIDEVSREGQELVTPMRASGSHKAWWALAGVGMAAASAVLTIGIRSTWRTSEDGHARSQAAAVPVQTISLPLVVADQPPAAAVPVEPVVAEPVAAAEPPRTEPPVANVREPSSGVRRPVVRPVSHNSATPRPKLQPTTSHPRSQGWTGAAAPAPRPAVTPEQKQTPPAESTLKIETDNPYKRND